MIMIKHTKMGAISFVSHIDTMRVLQRSLCRSGIAVKYTEGFNPHPITHCSHPLPLGVTSQCEYFFMHNIDSSAEEASALFDTSSPNGINALYAVNVSKNPNAAGKVVACDYFVAGDFTCVAEQFEQLLLKEEIFITYQHKDEEKTQNIRDLIYTLSATCDGIFMRIATGAPTLRPDRFTQFLNREFSLNIEVNEVTRMVQYVLDDNGAFLDMDSYIERFCE